MFQNIPKGTSETPSEEYEKKKEENPVVPEKKSDDPSSHKYDDFVYYKETERTTVLQPKHVKQNLHIINKMTLPNGDEKFIVLDALVLNTNQYKYWQKIIPDVYEKAYQKFQVEKQGAGKCELLNSCCFVSTFSSILNKFI